VIVSIPALRVQNEQNGDVTFTETVFQVQVNSNGGSYTVVAQPQILGKSDSEFQRAYEFDLPGSGPWNVRLVKLTADFDTPFVQNTINWQIFVEMIDEKFAYPNTGLVALTVDARQFNTIPDVSVRLRGKRVQVPTNYDAVNCTYTELLAGTFQW